MKKLLMFLMLFTMAVSLTGCGEKTTNAGPSENTPQEGYISMSFGHITINLPDVFGAVTENQGMYISGGPNSSISVTPALGIDLELSEWNEEVAAGSLDMFYGSTYTNLELAAFENDVDMNGNKAVYFAFNGVNANGVDRLVQVVRLYNADFTALYVITLIHGTEDEFFTPEVGGNIINSITLSQEAQHLEAEFEG